MLASEPVMNLALKFSGITESSGSEICTEPVQQSHKGAGSKPLRARHVRVTHPEILLRVNSNR